MTSPSYPFSHKPDIVIFDCDYTLWPYWADCHLSPPFNKVSEDKIIDSSGYDVKLYQDTIPILEYCRDHGLPMAIASKSPMNKMYQDLMKLFGIHKFFIQFEIYCMSKSRHMTAIQKKQSVEFQKMIFFDDEYGNIRTTRNMGVHAVHCPHERGVTWDIFMKALKDYDADMKRARR